jgi:hypothetical protein
MMSAYDHWVTHDPRPDAEMDSDEEVGILLRVLARKVRNEWGRISSQPCPPNHILDHVLEIALGDGEIWEAALREHRKAIDEEWAEACAERANDGPDHDE